MYRRCFSEIDVWNQTLLPLHLRIQGVISDLERNWNMIRACRARLHGPYVVSHVRYRILVVLPMILIMAVHTIAPLAKSVMRRPARGEYAKIDGAEDVGTPPPHGSDYVLQVGAERHSHADDAHGQHDVDKALVVKDNFRDPVL